MTTRERLEKEEKWLLRAEILNTPECQVKAWQAVHRELWLLEMAEIDERLAEIRRQAGITQDADTQATK